MNFFKEQTRARQKTVKLLCLFPLAILGIILFFYSCLFLFSIYLKDPGYIYGFRLHFIYLSLSIIVAVIAGSCYKIQQLKAGGGVVAEALGARFVAPNTDIPEEMRLRNIVTEMAIASSIPVPHVYILEDPSINAFAAGLTPQDAAIGVTDSAIRLLSREELQGVIAHEFSHILNGDMRLNTLLVGVLHGILIIGLTGEKILLPTANKPASTPSQDSNALDKKDSPQFSFAFIFIFMLVGFTLIVCGYVGVFFANLIKNAVNHQREFLADASAVAFTRNPSGIVGALKKIGGLKRHRTLTSNRASEFDHMFFTQAASQLMSAYMSTHPPLETRISRIDPNWDRKFTTNSAEPIASSNPYDNTATQSFSASAAPSEPISVSPLKPSQASSGYSASSAKEALQFIGAPQKQHLTAAQLLLQTLLQRLPEPIRQATHDSEQAQILVYRFLLHREPDKRDKQLALLQVKISPEKFDILSNMLRLTPILHPNYRLPLLNLAIPAIRQCSEKQIKTFLENLHLLVAVDQKMDLMEWCLIRILKTALQNTEPAKRQYQLSDVPDDIALILSALAYASEQSKEQVKKAFAKANTTLSVELKQALILTKDISLKNINNALNRLRELLPMQKFLLLEAMTQCVIYDNRVTTTEAELLRAISSSLDCPMPPLLESVTIPSS